ncbi:MAG: DUF4286 family protein [Ardenticatenales bacterium]
MYAYTVHAVFTDVHVAKAWVQWLRDGHVAEVIAAGAIGAAIVQIDGDGEPQCEARYTFASKATFDVYEHDHAPRLRAEAASRFPPGSVVYTRSSGAILWSSDEAHR